MLSSAARRPGAQSASEKERRAEARREERKGGAKVAEWGGLAERMKII